MHTMVYFILGFCFSAILAYFGYSEIRDEIKVYVRMYGNAAKLFTTATQLRKNQANQRGRATFRKSMNLSFSSFYSRYFSVFNESFEYVLPEAVIIINIMNFHNYHYFWCSV